MTTDTTGTFGGTYIGDPLPDKWIAPNTFPVTYPITYPHVAPVQPVKPSTDLAELLQLLKTQPIDKSIEERLTAIELSLTAILELLGTVLAARQQQLEQPEKGES